MKWQWLWSLLVAATCVAEVRYPEVAYLEDLKQPALGLKVLKRTPISLQYDPHTPLENLPKGQKVELLGWSEKQCYVAGRTATGPIRGWVATGALEQPAADVLGRLRKWIELRAQHRELIARQEVALEMTRDEVAASLGKPESRQRVAIADGEAEEWRYPKYRYVPHYYQTYAADGKMRQTVTYRRVALGRRVVRFQGETVVAVEENAEEQAPLGIVMPTAKPSP